MEAPNEKVDDERGEKLDLGLSADEEEEVVKVEEEGKGDQENFTVEESESELKRTNPFLTSNRKKTDKINEVPNVRPKRRSSSHKSSPLFSRISDSNGEIVKLNVIRTELYPGETIIGTLDFRDSTFSCTQFCVSLVAVLEKFQDEFPDGYDVERCIHATYSEVCLGYETTSFEIHIPQRATPTFQSEIVSFKWILKFEFVLSMSDFFAEKSENQLNWKAPTKLQVRTRKWETGINVYPL